MSRDTPAGGRRRRSVLVVTAHHDDLELGCGGTVARLVEAGHRVHSLVLTHSGYSDHAGRVVRRRRDALAEARAAAATLGYELIAYAEDTLDVPVSDKNTRRILAAVDRLRVDTLMTHWPGDTHPAHQRVHQMAVQASRRVARVFAFAVNWYPGTQPFHPTCFMPLEERHWRRKVAALRCYRSEYARAGRSWTGYCDRESLNLGVQAGAPRAEAFMTIKTLLEP